MLMVRTKQHMLETCNKLDLYVSPNLRKEETARRVEQEILNEPIAVLCSLSKTELNLVEEFVKAGPNQYITRKIRKNHYKLQKYSLILTYVDIEANEWKMLMPDSLRESLSIYLQDMLTIVKRMGRVPSYKELRMLALFGWLNSE